MCFICLKNCLFKLLAQKILVNAKNLKHFLKLSGVKINQVFLNLNNYYVVVVCFLHKKLNEWF